MRLAAQAKGGFYPTPPRVVDLIAGLIRVPAGYYHRNRESVRILDPCCGAGEAAAQLAQRLGGTNSLPIETYGVELHRDRAELAGGRLDRALAADLFQTSIANGAFGLALVNPPYDWDQEDKRVEHAFLTACTRYLADGGLLVFIVPKHRLAVSARFLASHYGRMRCWAFPDPEREVFDQVALMGYRKAGPELRRPRRGADEGVGRGRAGAGWRRTPIRPTALPPLPWGTSCSRPAPSIPSRLLRRPAVRGCGPARRSPTPCGPPRTSAPAR